MTDPQAPHERDDDEVADVSDDALDDVAGGVSPPGEGGSDRRDGGTTWQPARWP
jgi:hypothetical protein